MVCRYLNELKKRKTFERGTAARLFKGLLQIVWTKLFMTENFSVSEEMDFRIFILPPFLESILGNKKCV